MATSGTWTNWVGNQSFSPGSTAAPRDEEEVAALVKQAAEQGRGVRVRGAGHSFTPVVQTDGLLLDLSALRGVVDADPTRKRATAWAATRIHDFYEPLWEAGLALRNQGDIDTQQIAGAVATGTHGSSDRSGSLSSLVRRLEVVTPDGELRTVSRGDADFEGWVVAVGALGVVHRVTLGVVPSFEIRQQVYTGLPWERYVEELDTVMGSAYSVSAFVDWVSPEVLQLWVKSRPEEPEPQIDAVSAADTMSMIPGGDVEAVTHRLGLVGPWHERLPHFRAAFTPSAGAELQTEYFVPRRSAREAVEAVRRVGPLIRPLLQVAELRTIAADDLWLSGSYGEDVLGLHFTWLLDWDGVHAVLPQLEEALAPYAARPHWGKCFTTAPAVLDEVFTRLPDFRRLRDEVDPEDVCGNRFLDRVLGEREGGRSLTGARGQKTL